MLIIEDGSGVDGANSLIDVEWADNFLDMFGDCWCGCLDEKQRCLKQAAYMMLTLNWTGQLLNSGQRTAFPRKCAYDKCADPCCDKTLIGEDEVPEKVKEAQALLAMGLCSGGISPFMDNQRGYVESASISGINVTFEKGKGMHFDDIAGGECDASKAKCDPMPQIRGLLACFLKSRNSLGGKVRSVEVIQKFSHGAC